MMLILGFIRGYLMVLMAGVICLLLMVLLGMCANAGQLTCRNFEGTYICDGSKGYRSEQRRFEGRSYGSDNRGNHWEGRTFEGREYWQHWRRP
jgi:hypothetical protein